jgi:hypothetical protein
MSVAPDGSRLAIGLYPPRDTYSVVCVDTRRGGVVGALPLTYEDSPGASRPPVLAWSDGSRAVFVPVGARGRGSSGIDRWTIGEPSARPVLRVDAFVEEGAAGPFYRSPRFVRLPRNGERFLAWPHERESRERQAWWRVLGESAEAYLSPVAEIGPVSTVVPAADGRVAFAVEADGRAVVAVDLSTGATTSRLPVPAGKAVTGGSLAIGGPAGRLLVAPADNTIVVFDAASAGAAHSIDLAPRLQPISVALSPDGRWLAASAFVVGSRAPVRPWMGVWRLPEPAR